MAEAESARAYIGEDMLQKSIDGGLSHYFLRSLRYRVSMI
jgi:hypothetical protein